MNNEKIENALDEFAQMIAESQQTPLVATEPFEQYQHQIKAKIYAEGNQFRERFVKGYLAIKKELENS